MLKLLIIFIFSISLYGSNLKIASYNVENFFDLSYDKSEYNEFIPNNNSLWNQKNFNVKLNNLIKVIDDIDADIIGLQEIENKNLMQLLQKKLPKYKYFSFIKYHLFSFPFITDGMVKLLVLSLIQPILHEMWIITFWFRTSCVYTSHYWCSYCVS